LGELTINFNLEIKSPEDLEVLLLMVGVGVLANLLHTHKPEDTFYVYELGILERAYKEWTRVFPTIRPFYAVKPPLPCHPPTTLSRARKQERERIETLPAQEGT
jgi:hypothetical protein